MARNIPPHYLYMEEFVPDDVWTVCERFCVFSAGKIFRSTWDAVAAEEAGVLGA